MPRKVPKEVMKRMIASGRYTVTTLDGIEITDFTKLFNDATENDETVDDTEQPLPVSDIAPKPEPFPPGDFAGETVVKPITWLYQRSDPPYIEVDGKKFTKRQLEHFGDGLVRLAACTAVYEQTGPQQRLYFHFVNQLVTNKNLGKGISSKGTEAEIEIGKVYVTAGLEAGLKHAQDIVKSTAAWGNLCKLLEKK